MKKILFGASLLAFNAYGIAEVLACGGTFCGAPPPTPTAPAPVDQTAERIVFEVLDGRVVAHVQISYAGGADSFAWVVPVPSVPEVEESTATLFDTLQTQSGLSVQYPAPLPCNFGGGVSDGGGGGCGCADFSSPLSSAPTSAGGGGFDERAKPPVRVLSHDYTDNFEFHVVAGERTEDLVAWLQDNGYNVEPNMTPVIDPYNGPTANFLALKLRDGKSSTDIVPIKMTYEADRPMIPIRLTAVAAQPHMGILVFILADRPFTPGNYKVQRPDTDGIAFDWLGRTNYFEWVAREADEEDGQLFIEEYVGAAPALPELDGRSHAVLSRFYTRLSPELMTVDPMFEPHADREHAAPATLDFTTRRAVAQCGGPIAQEQPSECAFNYCGRGATCAVRAGQVACGCPQGRVATTVSNPSGNTTIACVPAENPFGVTGITTGAGTEFDPCNSFACGQGTCVLRGGFPTCRCEDGMVAELSGGALTCNSAPAGPTFGPGAGPESMPGSSALGMIGAGVSERLAAVNLWIAAFLILLLVVGRQFAPRSRTSRG